MWDKSLADKVYFILLRLHHEHTKDRCKNKIKVIFSKLSFVFHTFEFIFKNLNASLHALNCNLSKFLTFLTVRLITIKWNIHDTLLSYQTQQNCVTVIKWSFLDNYWPITKNQPDCKSTFIGIFVGSILLLTNGCIGRWSGT